MSWLKRRYEKVMYWVGICPRCWYVLTGRYDEGPFLSCECGTSEWTSKWPLLSRFFARTRESKVLRIWRFRFVLWNVVHWKPHLMRSVGGWTAYVGPLVVNYGASSPG